MNGETRVVIWAVVLVLSVIAICMFGWPYYRVWHQHMEGAASLSRAEQEKQIQIEQAKAELESAKIRAEAISLVGEAAQKYPEYRQQEFIGAFADAMKEGNIDQIIYVPTETNIPIVEARRPQLAH